MTDDATLAELLLRWQELRGRGCRPSAEELCVGCPELLPALRPHIVQLYEAGEHDGLPFFSLEFCEGSSLDRKLKEGPLPATEAAALAEQLARAIHYAHTQGVVHRDLKPANVLLTTDGTPKITD